MPDKDRIDEALNADNKSAAELTQDFKEIGDGNMNNAANAIYDAGYEAGEQAANLTNMFEGALLGVLASVIGGVAIQKLIARIKKKKRSEAITKICAASESEDTILAEETTDEGEPVELVNEPMKYPSPEDSETE